MLNPLYNLVKAALPFYLASLTCLHTAYTFAQHHSEDYQKQARVFSPLDDGYQRINPLLSEDGKQLWFSCIDHPDNIGRKGAGQDIWVIRKAGGKWEEATNDLPGLNTEHNDLVIGISGNGKTVYHVTIKQNSDEGLNKIKVSKFKDGIYQLDHTIVVPGLELFSEYYGYYVHPDEKIILLSFRGRYSFGKEDLYVCRKNQDGTWSAPEHLGGTINTTGYEMSPFLSPDTRYLYFAAEKNSSNGADIFVSRRINDTWKDWSEPVNLGSMVNSPGFDAYFTFNHYTQEAFFISTKGSENDAKMFHVHYEPAQTEQKTQSPHTMASGFIRLEKLPAMRVQLALLDEEDRVVQEITTDDKGFFNFSDFMPDRDYKIAVDDKIRRELDDVDIYLANATGDKVVFLNNNELGIFGFKVLSGQKVGTLANLEDVARKGEVVDSSIVIKGMVNAYGTINEKVKLNILDRDKKVIKTVETDEHGEFTFSTDALNKSYFLSVDQNSTGLVDVYEVFLTNDNPNEDIVVSKTDKYLFEFTALGKKEGIGLTRIEEQDFTLSEEMIRKYGMKEVSSHLNELSGFVRMGKLPLINVKVELLDEHDQVLGEAVTGSDGAFAFENVIDEEGEYKLQLKEADREAIGKSEIYIARSPAEMLVYLQRKQAGVFAFKKLSSEKKYSTLTTFEESVATGEVVRPKTGIRGRFDYQKLPKQGVELKLIDENEHVIEITKVDENGEFEFKNYTVDRNYFISVNDAVGGLSDIYEIYLSGERKNVLVNRTNQFVFAFKVLPSMDVILSEAYTGRLSPDTTAPLKNFTPRNRTADSSPAKDFVEINLGTMTDLDHAALGRAVEMANNGTNVRVRVTKSGRGSTTGKSTIGGTDMNKIHEYLLKAGAVKEQIQIKQTGSDQVIIYIAPSLPSGQ